MRRDCKVTTYGEEPEYHVEKDARTPWVAENLVNTMDLLVSCFSPTNTDMAERSDGSYYAVNITGP